MTDTPRKRRAPQSADDKPQRPKAPRVTRREGRANAPRGDETRARILDVALGLFRKHGLDATTMRQVADEAGVALGSAYYYFPSKEAIVLAYYEETQVRVTARVREAYSASDDVGERLRAVLHARIDALARDRRLLAALFRSVADPADDLSVFSARTASVRDAGIAQLMEALAPSPELAALPAETRTALGLGLWMLQLGSILYMVHDASPKLARTHKLIDDVVGLVVAMIPMMPILSSAFGERIVGILRDAALVPGR